MSITEMARYLGLVAATRGDGAVQFILCNDEGGRPVPLSGWLAPNLAIAWLTGYRTSRAGARIVGRRKRGQRNNETGHGLRSVGSRGRAA